MSAISALRTLIPSRFFALIAASHKAKESNHQGKCQKQAAADSELNHSEQVRQKQDCSKPIRKNPRAKENFPAYPPGSISPPVLGKVRTFDPENISAWRLIVLFSI